MDIATLTAKIDIVNQTHTIAESDVFFLDSAKIIQSFQK